MIRDLFDFRWPKPIKTDLAKWDQNRRCAYHKDHGHTMKQCRNLHYLVEILIRVGHLKQYVCTAGGQKELAWDLVNQSPTTSTTPKVVISYIHGGPIDKKYNSKQKRQRLLHAIFVREWISFIQHNLADGSTHPIDGIITFPPVNANRVLRPHKDALILTLGISVFNVRRVLIDLGNSTDLLKLSAYR